MNYTKLIGYQLDTNQYTSSVITSKKEAVEALNTIITIYGEEIIDYMFLKVGLQSRFTTYAKEGLTLRQFLSSEIK